MKLEAKYIINGRIEALTGLHIGGSTTGLEIGGLDNSVIKDAMGVPYIPGSSLKGKLRSILEKSFRDEKTIEHPRNGLHIKGDIATIFGAADHKNDTHRTLTRFFARDAYMNKGVAEKMEHKAGDFEELEFDYTESKMENVINRIKGNSDNLRTLERVPAGAEFDFQFVVDQYEDDGTDLLDKIFIGMAILEDDYIGGSGSRGYGQIKFQIDSVIRKTIDDYTKGSEGVPHTGWDEEESRIKEKIDKFVKVGG